MIKDDPVYKPWLYPPLMSRTTRMAIAPCTYMLPRSWSLRQVHEQSWGYSPRPANPGICTIAHPTPLDVYPAAINQFLTLDSRGELAIGKIGDDLTDNGMTFCADGMAELTHNVLPFSFAVFSSSSIKVLPIPLL